MSSNIDTQEDTLVVTTTYTMSNGEKHVLTSYMDDEELRRHRGDARAIAHNHAAIIINTAFPRGSIEYLNPSQVASVNITVVPR